MERAKKCVTIRSPMRRPAARFDQERLFVREPFRHYRRSYSVAEFRWGIASALLLAGIAGWIAWKGAHPDPDLYGEGAVLVGEPPAVDRGPVPTDLGTGTWEEGPLAVFGPDNLYEKINGREGFFKSFGFKTLYFLSLNHRGESDSDSTIDIEFYDLGAAENAFGAYAGERGPSQKATSDAGSAWHIARNALLMARGRYYIRAIGSDESETVVAQLERLRETFSARIAATPLPWGYIFLKTALDTTFDRISYFPENGFSFSFAKDLYVSRIDEEGGETFVCALARSEEATVLAEKFMAGFASLGKEVNVAGATWVRDRYLGKLAFATSRDRFVIGVRGVSSYKQGVKLLAQLGSAVDRMPEALEMRAVPKQDALRHKRGAGNEANDNRVEASDIEE